jgi:hypothetical protein
LDDSIDAGRGATADEDAHARLLRIGMHYRTSQMIDEDHTDLADCILQRRYAQEDRKVGRFVNDCLEPDVY